MSKMNEEKWKELRKGWRDIDGAGPGYPGQSMSEQDFDSAKSY